MLIKSYIICVLATGYGTINFIKVLKGSRSTRAHISNINSINKRREHRSHKLEKGDRRKKEFLFQIPNIYIGSNKMIR